MQELLGLDVLHKFMWTKLITRMFEAMTGNFAYSGDIHLFLNVLSGTLTDRDAMHFHQAYPLHKFFTSFLFDFKVPYWFIQRTLL